MLLGEGTRDNDRADIEMALDRDTYLWRLRGMGAHEDGKSSSQEQAFLTRLSDPLLH